MILAFLVIAVALWASGVCYAAEVSHALDYFKAKEILAEVEGLKLSPNGKLSVAAPTVLAYSSDGKLLHVSEMKEVSGENMLQDRLSEKAKLSRYANLSALASEVPTALEQDSAGGPVVVMLFPPQSRILCEPCKTSRPRLEQVLAEKGLRAKVVEIDLIYRPTN